MAVKLSLGVCTVCRRGECCERDGISDLDRLRRNAECVRDFYGAASPPPEWSLGLVLLDYLNQIQIVRKKLSGQKLLHTK